MCDTRTIFKILVSNTILGTRPSNYRHNDTDDSHCVSHICACPTWQTQI